MITVFPRPVGRTTNVFPEWETHSENITCWYTRGSVFVNMLSKYRRLPKRVDRNRLSKFFPENNKLYFFNIQQNKLIKNTLK